MILEEIDIKISNKICEYIEKIASFNNNRELKIDLESYWLIVIKII